MAKLFGISFGLSSIVKEIIKQMSLFFELLSPDEITPEQKAEVQKYVGSFYALAKHFGPELVAGSNNDLDDTLLAELLEICELAAQKYGLELNPGNL